jgi:phage/plasmid-associated DNA primase
MTNAPVQISEASAAIRNRLVIFECRVVFDEKHLVGVGAIADKAGYKKVHKFLLATEKPGIFNWMLAGMRRAMERGHFVNTEEGEAALSEMQTESGIVGAFLEECVSFGADFMITVPDFCAAFKAHWQQNKATKHGTPANENVSRALRAIGDPCIGVNTKELRDKKKRYYAGMNLNAVGLEYWQAANDADRISGRAATVQASGTVDMVNHNIPPTWYQRPFVKRLRKADFTKHQSEGAESLGDDAGALPVESAATPVEGAESDGGGNEGAVVEGSATPVEKKDRTPKF